MLTRNKIRFMANKINADNKRLLTEEKSKEYAENRQKRNKENREQRKKEKEEGKLGSRRLAFIENIMKAYGVSRPELARRMNNTAQNLYWIFSVRDDCTLGKAKEMLSKLGITLDVKIVRKSRKKAPSPRTIESREYTTSDKVVSRLVGDLPDIIMSADEVRIPEYISGYPDGKNLSFLARYIESVGYPISKLENLIGMSRGAFRQIFMTKRDDVDISKIYDIARVSDGEINWIVTKL